MNNQIDLKKQLFNWIKKENLRELLLDFKFCYDIISNIFLNNYFNKIKEIKIRTFNIGTYDEVKGNIKFL